MAEKINGQGMRPADTAATRRTDAAKPATGGGASKAASTAAAGDTVNITRSGLLLTKLEEVVQSTPIVDADRVRAMKDALASGQYEADSQRIAARLLRLERDLLA